MMKHNKGFTLIELMIVVAIIGIIAMFALPSYQNAQRKARITEALAQMTELQSQIEKARLTGRVPYNKIELHESKSGPEGEKENRKVYIKHDKKIRYNNDVIYTIDYSTNTDVAHKYFLTASVNGSWIKSDDKCRELHLDGLGNLKEKNYCQK